MKDLKIFSGSSNHTLSLEVADSLNSRLGDIQLSKFADGENNVKILENIRGSDIFIIQSMNNSANDHMMELLLMLDAFKRASAGRITVVIPYYGYARQDRKVEPRVPISAKMIATLIQCIGSDHVLCMDLHSDQIQGFFDIPVDHLFSAPIMIDYFKGLGLRDIVIVSPDSGGTERVRFFAKQLNTEIAIIDKRRSKPNDAKIMHIVGDVRNKNCILIDDIIDTGNTICKGAKALKNEGALSVRAGATHGVFSLDASAKLQNSVLEEVIITNTINLSEDKKFKKLKMLSVAALIGKAIQRIHREGSVSSLFL